MAMNPGYRTLMQREIARRHEENARWERDGMPLADALVIIDRALDWCDRGFMLLDTAQIRPEQFAAARKTLREALKARKLIP